MGVLVRQSITTDLNCCEKRKDILNNFDRNTGVFRSGFILLIVNGKTITDHVNPSDRSNTQELSHTDVLGT